MVQKISIRLGESGDDFVQRIGKKAVRVNKQPAGMNFYDIDWTIYNPGPGQITFEHGMHTFTISNALGAMGSTFEPDNHKWGIFSFDLSFGLTAPELIPHDEARQKFIALLKMLQEKGWRQFYYRDAARIMGRSSLHSINIDVRYIPTFEEWIALEDGAGWNLEADGVYMRIVMYRDDDRLNPLQPGAYFMTMELHNEEDEVRSHFLYEDRDNWKVLWPDRMKKAHESRTKEEAAARAKGYQIDTDYQDPPIKSLIKPELKVKVGDVCPKDGIWEASRTDSMAETLATYHGRWRQFTQGQTVTGFGQGLPGFDEDNKLITWTWRKPLP
ncbi:hypothetical protein ACO0KY_15400 [Undibacterium sp. Dicai25W]|uniref:hypothetical protein n=1 Tax=Undibacterium sp. Dicai25W TaxID=3413034 RepID=UPI003BF2ACBA